MYVVFDIRSFLVFNAANYNISLEQCKLFKCCKLRHYCSEQLLLLQIIKPAGLGML